VRIVDRGSGAAVVVIPGIQGRWEWMTPGVDALARRCRVITYSLCDEPSCGGSFDEETGFDCYVEQVREALDQAGVERATICGLSYGGLIACAFAARYPERTRGLVLISALPPSWTPDARVRFYLRAPRLLMPMFMLASLRMYREIAAAHPGAWAGAREAVRHAWNVLTHMFSPSRMARRVHLLARARLGNAHAGHHRGSRARSGRSSHRHARIPAVAPGRPHGCRRAHGASRFHHAARHLRGCRGALRCGQ
jgi:pimeloyl-ACP methyl ester carboxylesterase